MNCPYCDETIHPQAKFCAKCGLPLKEDTTVHGVSASDEVGPSKYVIGALLGGIALIGLLIAVLGNQRSSATQARQPEPPRNYAAPGMGSGIAGSRPVQPAFNNVAQAPRSTFQAPRADANTASQTRYAYTPPAQLPATFTMPEPTPPPVPLLLMTTADAPKPSKVTVVRANTPAIPRLPDAVIAAAIPAMPDTIEATSTEDGELVNPNPNLYVWDPVHERWAKRPDARRRPTTRTRRGIPTGQLQPSTTQSGAFEMRNTAPAAPE
jgi:hypothetical protein